MPPESMPQRIRRIFSMPPRPFANLLFIHRQDA